MDVLEHPLEAVAFRLCSLPFPDASAASGAAAWTCLAAVLAAAAAAGLWRLRSSTPASGTEALKALELEAYKAKELQLDTTRSSLDSAASTMSPAASSPKERYTACYYRDSGRVGCCDVDDDEGDKYEEDEAGAEEQDEHDGDGVYQTSAATDPFGPTAVELGGRYRSPTAALARSSSVVRLWDEAVDAGVTASPRRRSRVVGTVAAF
ncbi:hypothetical protein PR202_gb17614 [Eleusine coracana subsp. coracana]|uniref:Uncharacterized protein n=1 Tax=Eleusine coracana subsp. coracana TaxID=191504 RepID=A0AAV5F371_ELECO|nr:hypothetical protein PR202_gb17614 [Eleusine coracana subsp. coracana]